MSYTVFVCDLSEGGAVLFEETGIASFEAALMLAQVRQREYPLPRYKVLTAGSDDPELTVKDRQVFIFDNHPSAPETIADTYTWAQFASEEEIRRRMGED